MIEYKAGVSDIDWTQLVELYSQVGMVNGLGEAGDVENIKEAFSHSYRVVTAWEKGRLIGAGRVLSDGVCYAMIFDVGVIPEYRRKGIATGIMQELLKGLEYLAVHLTSRFGVEDLYTKLGFKRHKNAFARYPHDSEYLTD